MGVKIVVRGSWFVVREQPGVVAGQGSVVSSRPDAAIAQWNWSAPVRGQAGAPTRAVVAPKAAGTGRLLRGAAVLTVLLFVASPASAQEAARAGTAEERFKEATRQLHAGDAQQAIAIYRILAAAGAESASLYWNWAQAASSKGAVGEALWALLRAREIAGADMPAVREIERLRQSANLDTAELAPDPLAAVARAATAFHLDLVALVLLALSLAGHALARAFPAARWPVAAAWLALVAGSGAGAVTLAGARAHPAAVVIRRGVPLADAASPTASTLATLREGEVVPVLGASGAYLRIQDSSGARGWVTDDDVWRLDRPPSPTP